MAFPPDPGPETRARAAYLAAIDDLLEIAVSRAYLAELYEKADRLRELEQLCISVCTGPKTELELRHALREIRASVSPCRSAPAPTQL